MNKRHFLSTGIVILILSAVVFVPNARSEEFKKNKTGLYRDFFDQNIYYEGIQYLHLERFYRALTRKKAPAKDVNIFDEVPDSPFFTNRHARQRLTAEELSKGFQETDGPDLSGNLTIVDGKFEGSYPGFRVRDAKGDEYLLKFDPIDNMELATSAEVIASRFYHALGYNVPQYTIAEFELKKLVPRPDAKIADNSGFKKKLTQEKLEEYMIFLPQDSQGRYRASASKIISGKNKGFFSYLTRRKNDPLDKIDHRERRELRALQVFSSWLNNFDMREQNTMDILVEENGQQVLKHYLFDFNASFGASASGAKSPMIGHEFLMDYGETTKAFLTLGFWEKPWQKRWREVDEKYQQAPAVGYFDNRHFDPAKYKIQLPQYVFKDLTRADAFWAAKIMSAFTNEDISAMIKAGQLSHPEDADYLTKTLSERRDIIVRYWFDQANPLDVFDFSGDVLTFKDLAVEKGFQTNGSTYHFAVVGKKGKHKKRVDVAKSSEPSLKIDPAWFNQYEGLDVWIRTARPGAKKLSPYVLVELSRNAVSGITHQD